MVTKSSLVSETLALGDPGFLIDFLVQEIFGLNILLPVQCYSDKSSLINALQTSIIVSDKRLWVDIARLEETASEEEVKVYWVDGKLHL